MAVKIECPNCDETFTTNTTVDYVGDQDSYTCPECQVEITVDLLYDMPELEEEDEEEDVEKG